MTPPSDSWSESALNEALRKEPLDRLFDRLKGAVLNLEREDPQFLENQDNRVFPDEGEGALHLYLDEDRPPEAKKELLLKVLRESDARPLDLDDPEKAWSVVNALGLVLLVLERQGRSL